MDKKKRVRISDSARKLLKMLHKKDEAIDGLSKALSVSKEGLFELAHELRKVGYKVVVVGKNMLSLSREIDEDNVSEAISVSEVRRRYRIAFFSEVRMGTYQAQISLLHGLYKACEEHENIDFAVMVGGLLVGKPTPTLKPDVLPFLLDPEKDRADKAEDLVNYVVKNYPMSDKFKTYILSSSREMKLRTEDGLDLISAICEQRQDLKFAGELKKIFDVRGVRIMVASPWDDNAPLGVSYGVQKNTDKISERIMPQIVIYGGSHERSEIPDYGKHGIYVYTVPSLHLQMTRQNKRGVLPRVGCLILELNFNEGGTCDFNTGLKAHHISLDAYTVGNDCIQAMGDIVGDKLSEDEKKIAQFFTEDRKISEGALSRRLKKDKATVQKCISSLNEAGYSINFSWIAKEWEVEEVLKTNFKPFNLKYDEVFVKLTKYADISDTHYGSWHDLPEVVGAAVKDAVMSGARRIFHSGDLEEGPGSGGYRGHQNDVRYVSADDIEDYTVSKWPKHELEVDPKWPLIVTELYFSEKGEPVYKEVLIKNGKVPLQTSAIDGNHDCWEVSLTGRSPVRSLSLRIPGYLHYIGTRKFHQFGSFLFDGVFHRLIHPKGGIGYTLSTKVQKHLDAEMRRNERAGKPFVVHLGHLHVAYMLFRDGLGYLTPCFKSEDEFLATLGLMPSIGMFLFELYGNKDGKLTRVVSDYRNYRHLVIEGK